MISMIACRDFMVVAVIVAMVSSGCTAGPETGKVSGRVTFQGKPYSEAAIVFFSLKTGGGGTANLADDGTFSLPTELVVGEYQVYLAPKLADQENDDAPPAPVRTDIDVPGRYWSESSTDISFTVEPGENEATIALTD